MKEFPDPWRELGEFIREQRSVARLSVRRLSDMAGISNPYLSQIERGLRRPSAEILQQIAKALQLSAETLYVRAGILDPRETGADLTEAILAEPDLTDDQKQTLMRIYTSFRRENGILDPERGEGEAAAAGAAAGAAGLAVEAPGDPASAAAGAAGLPVDPPGDLARAAAGAAGLPVDPPGDPASAAAAGAAPTSQLVAGSAADASAPTPEESA